MYLEDKFLFDSELFDKLVREYKQGLFTKDNNVIKTDIGLPEKYVYSLENEKELKEIGENALKNNEVAIVIVNGGMATRFGNKVKGIVPVWEDKSFLEIKISNVKYINKKYGITLPIVIMNSLATDKKTVDYLESKNYFGYDKSKINFIYQFVFKRIISDGTEFSDKTKLLYGPGHGDFFYAFKKSDFYKNNLNIKYIVFSNVDNLGAVVNPSIIGHHIKNNTEVTVEVAQKYPGDKGGAPAVINDKPQIVEGFKFPQNFNQDKIEVFNTATYVFSSIIFEKKIKLPFYVVEKKINDNTVIQFERLAGDLTMFCDCEFLKINREERFFPIKTVDDLEKQRDKIKKTIEKYLEF